MQIQLNTADVLAAAIKLEERGVRFYAEAATKFSGAARTLLTLLSGMEEGHAQHFKNILTELPARGAVADAIDAEEAGTYLNALTSDRIIIEACKPMEGDTYDVILEKAMLLEKNSVFFYTMLKGILQEHTAVEAVERIIGEETTHYNMLNEALSDWRRRHPRGRGHNDE